MTSRRHGWLVGTPLVLALAACGGRDASFGRPIGTLDAVGLNRAVVLGDEAMQRVVLLQSGADRDLSVSELPVGKNRVRMLPAIGGDRLLVLSSGVLPRLDTDDELPSLSVIDAASEPRVVARYELPDPFSSVTLDPEGRWAVLSGSADNFVTNPNQLVLVDLSDPEFEPVTKTIRSFGAAPERFRFTEPLSLPGGERRLLIVETRQDVSLVDLADLERPEITIGLPVTLAGATGHPAEVVVHAGATPEETLLAIRLVNDSNVVLVSFTPDDAAPLGFNPTLNLVDVGSPPAALDFVATDARLNATDTGLRLAALVPDRREATLVNPSTTRVERLELPARFDQLRRVTEETLSSAGGGDVALLWSQATSMVAFWSLGRTSNQAFRSVDVLNLEAAIRTVFDVPGSVFGHRKLLQANDNRFFVLDLETRESFPMLSSNQLSLSVAPDGLRAWAFSPATPRLAQIDLKTLEPTSLSIERPIGGVFDIENSDGGGGRTLLALHTSGAFGVTVMNAVEPDTADTRFVPSLLLGDNP